MDRDGIGATFTLRAAGPADAAAVAEIYLRARVAAVPAIPPLVHGADDVRRWFRDVVIPARETWIAEDAGRPVAVMVLDGGTLDQLYVRPQRASEGAGSQLIHLAQARRPGGLSLWTFQSNDGARRFYERHGFVAAERTDGGGNEEQAPDVRYVWSPNRHGGQTSACRCGQGRVSPP